MMPFHILTRISRPRFSGFALPVLIAFVVLSALFFLSPQHAHSTDITFAWDPNTEPDLAGYRVFHRPAGQNYDYNNPAWEGTATTCTISVPDDGNAYYFVARAFITSGLESADTNELTYQPSGNISPTANAGADQTVNEGSGVILDGSNSSDPDGSISSYSWSQTGGTSVSLSGASSSRPTFTAPIVGGTGQALTFQLTVTDNGGLSATDTVIVNVSNVNQAPTANAGPDQTVNEESSVTLDGSNSSDPDGTISSYSWSQTGGTSVSLSGASSSRPTFTAPTVGGTGQALTFQLTVTDDGGLSATDTVIINISNINQAPTANAGPDQTVNEGSNVTLDGSNSSDSDGTISSYNWSQTGGGSVSLSGASSSKPTFTAPTVGAPGDALTFQLTVTDNGGSSATDTVTINVSNMNQAPTANAGPDQTVDEQTMVTLDSSNSSDPDDDNVSYLWTQTSGTSVSLSDATASQPTFTSPAVGSNGEALTFHLTVTDGSGLNSSDTCIVNVTHVNVSPMANAGLDQTVFEGDTVTLIGSNSSDPDGDIVSYLWSQTEGTTVSLSDAAAPQPTFTAHGVGSGGESLTFQLTVTDDGGLISTDTCIVNISWVNAAPAANAGPDQTVEEGSTVILGGSNSYDPDGVIVNYTWTQTAGTSATLSDTTASQPNLTAPTIASSAESLTFQLTVTDDGDLQSTDTCIVNVTQANMPPTADAGSDQTVNEKTIVNLDGSNSSDPDDVIASYVWEQIAGPGITLSDPTSVQPTFTSPNVGKNGKSLSFQLTVTDSMGLQSTDVSIVNVTWMNSPPKANGGNDKNKKVKEGGKVTLDASNSSDPDDGIVSYSWEQTSGTPVTFSDPTAAKMSFVAPSVDESGTILSFQVKVTDAGGLQSHDEIYVTVEDNGITGFPEDVITTTVSTGENIGIKVDSGGSLTNLITIDPASLPESPNMPANLVDSLIDMEIKVDTIGGTVTGTIYLSDPASDDYQWLKYDSNVGLVDYSDIAVFNDARDQVTLTLTDGGKGDADGVANGMITDTAGLVFAQLPTVSTGSATSITLDSAELKGTINPNGVSTTFYFEYGTTTSYGSATTEIDAGSGSDDVQVSTETIGLSEGTTYHYRLVAKSIFGTSYGHDAIFTTYTTAVPTPTPTPEPDPPPDLTLTSDPTPTDAPVSPPPSNPAPSSSGGNNESSSGGCTMSGTGGKAENVILLWVLFLSVGWFVRRRFQSHTKV
jgi:hypothetical protein